MSWTRGERVRVDHPGSAWHGLEGRVASCGEGVASVTLGVMGWTALVPVGWLQPVEDGNDDADGSVGPTAGVVQP